MTAGKIWQEQKATVTVMWALRGRLSYDQDRHDAADGRPGLRVDDVQKLLIMAAKDGTDIGLVQRLAGLL